MSDDEAGELDPIEEEAPGAEPTDLSATAEGEPDEGSEDEADFEAEDAEAAEADAEELFGQPRDGADYKSLSSDDRRAHPQARQLDPLLRASNRPRPVVVVPPDERVTDSRLHKTEAAFLIAMRAEQISRHGTTFTDAAGLSDPVDRAMKELLDRRCPLLLRRAVGTGAGGELLVEEWNPREMVLPDITPSVALGGSEAQRAHAAR